MDLPPNQSPVFAPSGTLIETADVTALQNSSSEALISEINKKHALVQWSIVFLVCISAGFLLLVAIGTEALTLAAYSTAALLSYFALRAFDRRRKVVIINYELDSHARSKHEHVCTALRELAKSRRIWRIITRDAVYDPKYQAGASQTLTRKAVQVRSALPRFFTTNVPIWSIETDIQTLYFFPEHILVFGGAAVGVVGYDQLGLLQSTARFIEADGVPADAQVVGRTWRFVNKNGLPDRRFANNSEIPVCLYGDLNITSTTGMNLLIHVSSISAAKTFADEWHQLRGTTATSAEISAEILEPVSHEETVMGVYGWAPAAAVMSALAAMLFGAIIQPPPVKLPPIPTIKAAVKAPKYLVQEQAHQPAVIVANNASDADISALLVSFSKKRLSIMKGSSGHVLVYRKLGASSTRSNAKPVPCGVFVWNGSTARAFVRTSTGEAVLLF